MTTRRTTGRRKPLGKSIREWTLYTGGWALIWHQALVVPSQDFNLTLALIGAALIGVPGASQVWALRSGSASPPPAEDSPPSQPSSASASEAEQ
jgi:hypothetical protein